MLRVNHFMASAFNWQREQPLVDARIVGERNFHPRNIYLASLIHTYVYILSKNGEAIHRGLLTFPTKLGNSSNSSFPNCFRRVFNKFRYTDLYAQLFLRSVQKTTHLFRLPQRAAFQQKYSPYVRAPVIPKKSVQFLFQTYGMPFPLARAPLPHSRLAFIRTYESLFSFSLDGNKMWCPLGCFNPQHLFVQGSRIRLIFGASFDFGQNSVGIHDINPRRLRRTHFGVVANTIRNDRYKKSRLADASSRNAG